MHLNLAFPALAGLVALAGCVAPPSPILPPAQPVAMLQQPAEPASILQRISNQEERVTQDQGRGRMDPGQVAHARDNLRDIRRQYQRFLDTQAGTIGPGQNAELNRRLDNTLRFIEVNEH